jgi:glucokinase
MNLLFDIGATNTRVAAAAETGIGEVFSAPTADDPEKEVALLAELFEKAGKGDAAFGGIPGTPGMDGSVLFAPNLPKWKGFPLSGKLSALVGMPVSLEHDASLGALGEAVYGAGKGAERVAYFGIGTGVGAGFAIGGAIQSPVTGYETGHQIIDAARGLSLDDTVSGRAVEKRAGTPPGEAPRALYEELTDVLAAGIYNTALHFMPDVFVLGGSLMNEENGYRLADIAAAVKALPPYVSPPDIRLASLGGASNLWGAKALAEAH